MFHKETRGLTGGMKCTYPHKDLDLNTKDLGIESLVTCMCSTRFCSLIQERNAVTVLQYLQTMQSVVIIQHLRRHLWMEHKAQFENQSRKTSQFSTHKQFENSAFYTKHNSPSILCVRLLWEINTSRRCWRGGVNCKSCRFFAKKKCREILWDYFLVVDSNSTTDSSDTRTSALKLKHILIVLTAVMELYVTGGTLRQVWNMEDTTPLYMNVSLRLTEALRPLKTMYKVKLKFKPSIIVHFFENRLRIPIFGLLCI